jgi:hypothetical protein
MTTTSSLPSTDEQLFKAARKRVARKMGFYTHLTVFVLVNALMMLLNLRHGGFQWHVFPLFGWGIGLAVHGILTLLSLGGHGLHQRMLASELATLKRRQA